MSLVLDRGVTLCASAVLVAASLTAPRAQTPEAAAQGVATQQAGAQDATAQDVTAKDATAQDATAQDAAAKDAAAKDAATGAADALDYSRIESADTALRCFPTEHSPTYGETLAVGDVVLAGEARDGFRAVQLPLGVVGYVHKRFTTVDEERGVVQSQANKLSFRYRPNSDEAPVCFVEPDTEFHLVAEEAEWWVVRYPGAEAWVAESDLTVFGGDEPVETLEKGRADLEKRQRAAVAAIVAARHEVRAAEAAATERRASLTALQDRFAAEYRKANEEQSYDALLAELATFEAGLDEEDALVAEAAGLRGQIELQVRSLAALALVNEGPVPATIDDLPKPTVRDPLRSFTAVGWLRYDDSLFGARTFRLEKGGQIQFFVTCSSSRYDLRLFDGLEVGIHGDAERPGVQSMRVLDVERLEVFSLPGR